MTYFHQVELVGGPYDGRRVCPNSPCYRVIRQDPKQVTKSLFALEPDKLPKFQQGNYEARKNPDGSFARTKYGVYLFDWKGWEKPA